MEKGQAEEDQTDHQELHADQPDQVEVEDRAEEEEEK